MAALDEMAAEIRAVTERARAVVGQVGVARLGEGPAGGGWSVAECLEHLNMSTRAFLPRWRAALQEARTQGLRGEDPYKTDLWGKLLVWTLEPPPKFRMPTTPQFQKIETPPAERVLSDFVACQEELLGVLRDARGLALDKVKVRSPFQERMQYSAWSSFRVTASHERRHLWQAERVARIVGGER